MSPAGPEISWFPPQASLEQLLCWCLFPQGIPAEIIHGFSRSIWSSLMLTALRWASSSSTLASCMTAPPTFLRPYLVRLELVMCFVNDERFTPEYCFAYPYVARSRIVSSGIKSCGTQYKTYAGSDWHRQSNPPRSLESNVPRRRFQHFQPDQLPLPRSQLEESSALAHNGCWAS